MFNETPPCKLQVITFQFVDTNELVKVMNFHEFCVWLARPIYDIETKKLCSAKGK